MTRFMTKDKIIPPYMAFPRFILENTTLNETSKILYIVLLDRARISAKNSSFIDEYNHVFILFPIKSLAEVMHKSEMSIKAALSALEHQDLIFRKRQGIGMPNKIYIKFPNTCEIDKNLSVIQTENSASDGKNIVFTKDSKLSSNNNDIKNNNKNNNSIYGNYKNVFLTDEQIKSLRNEFTCCDEYIEKLSSYMMSSGKKYKDHAATIRSWILRDKPKRNYECKEYESL